ncbi:MAG: hypothetical protein Kapaf2KO_21510 [Candidatus Kapaibacteriales bacterium]
MYELFYITLVLAGINLIASRLAAKTFKLSGLYPTAWSFRELIVGISLAALAFLPYLFIYSEDILFSSNSEIWWDLAGLVAQSIDEELFFRGALLLLLAKWKGPWGIVLATALMFSALHLMNPSCGTLSTINTFMAGILMGVMAVQTKSLFLPIGFHVGWNVIQGPILGLPVSGFEFESFNSLRITPDSYFWGDSYGAESGLWCLLVLCLYTFVTLKYIRPHPFLQSAWFKYLYNSKSNQIKDSHV